MHKSTSNEKVLVSIMTIKVVKESLIIFPRQGKTPISTLNNFCGELGFTYLFLNE